MFLYHRVPQNLAGTVLYPLNQLKQKHPALYAAHVAKYDGREALMYQNIPPLDYLWNDVLHFCLVHPELIHRGLLAAGFEPKPMQWFEVDSIALDCNSNNTAIYLNPPKRYGDFTKLADDFVSFDETSLAELSTLPEATLDYYKHCQKTGETPLLFHRIPHVLYRGCVSLDSGILIDILIQ